MRTYGYASMAVGFDDVTVTTRPVIYREFKRKKSGLDWDKHRDPNASNEKFMEAIRRENRAQKARNRKNFAARSQSTQARSQIVPPLDVELLIADYKSGMPQRDLFAKHHRSRGTVVKVLQEAGVYQPRKIIQIEDSKTCTICGQQFERKPGEASAKWALKMTCSFECRKKAISEGHKRNKH